MIEDGSTGEFMHIRYYGFMEKWPNEKSENVLFPEVNSRNFDHAGHGGIGKATGLLGVLTGCRIIADDRRSVLFPGRMERVLPALCHLEQFG